MSYDQFMFDEAFRFDDEQLPPEIPDSEEIKLENKRVPPLGACSNDSTDAASTSHILDLNSFLQLQEQSEQLNSSLYALTSHFAQVQFRLKQIIHGPKEGQEKLLAELEDFAFEGCPDVIGPKKISCISCQSHSAVEHYEQRIADEKEREKRLNLHLVSMIDNLEACKTQVDAASTKRTNIVREDIDICDKAVPVELTKYVDEKMAKLIDPGKAKEVIISEVSKQISDMEKFVSFLNNYEASSFSTAATMSPGNQRNTAVAGNEQQQPVGNKVPAPHTRILQMSEEKRKRLHQASLAVIKKSLAVLQIFAISQFGCSARHFREYMVKKTFREDATTAGFVSKPLESIRSSLDQVIALHTKLIMVGGLHPDSEDELNLPLSTADKRASWSCARSVSIARSRTESVSSVASLIKSPEMEIQEQLVRIVRGNFTFSLKELLQHGLCQSFSTSTLSTKALVGCMATNSVHGLGLHIWEYFNKFYNLKHGNQFNNQPNVMLSEAFAMDVGCTQQTPKQSLLTVMHRIKTTHESRKRSFDAMFKALVSAGLNRGRLAQWVRLVIRCPELVNRHYERWSYVIRTGFDDILTLLEKLSTLTFFLPEDLAIRHLLKNTNEFGDA